MTLNKDLDLSNFDGEKTDMCESECLEYKMNMSQGIIRNIHDTICAFLNRNGGHIIVGIRDDRTIVGINFNLFDKFIVDCIDSITNQSMIIHGANGYFVNPFLIIPKLHKTALGKYLCVVQVKTDLPEITGDVRSHYRIKTGESFFRLNASNFMVSKSNHLFTLNEANSLELHRALNLKSKVEEKFEKMRSLSIKLNRELSNAEVENFKLQREIKTLKKYIEILEIGEKTSEEISEDYEDEYLLSGFYDDDESEITCKKY